MLLKTKPSDKVMEDLLVAVAALCDPGLGILFDDFRKDLGLRGCHERELAIYGRATPAVRSLMPRLIGTCREPVSGMWSIAMEYLPEAEDVAIAPGAWTERHTTAVLRSIGACHGAWYKNGARVTRWLSSLPHTKRMKEMEAVVDSARGVQRPVLQGLCRALDTVATAPSHRNAGALVARPPDAAPYDDSQRFQSAKSGPAG